MYKIKLEHNGSKLIYVTYVDSNEELGNFLLNLSINYEIRGIHKVNYAELLGKEEFINKNPDIEFGKEEV